jgi:hypothetical protein
VLPKRYAYRFPEKREWGLADGSDSFFTDSEISLSKEISFFVSKDHALAFSLLLFVDLDLGVLTTAHTHTLVAANLSRRKIKWVRMGDLDLSGTFRGNVLASSL